MKLFGATHLITVLIVLSVITLVVGIARYKGVETARKWGRRIGIGLPIYYLLESIFRYTEFHVEFIVLLPFEICSILFFIGAYAYLTGSVIAAEIVYLWTCAGTIHTLITPTPDDIFPSIEYARYFVSHGLLIFNAFYMLIALGVRITFKSVLRAYGAFLGWMVFVGMIDWIFDRNFMFLRAKPYVSSAMDWMGPWPAYLITGQSLVIVSFLIWWGVAVLIRRKFPVAVSTETGSGKILD
jgi:hypothetical integral membrane protein (TIGR02206 family)